ncbi:POTRA domain-containing protein [Polaribacter cellanae]|uniref:POTRA domain-containing protein n=1 Tax=Polaribacter cellanae TaxID=2818493 RepID=UPI001FB5BD3B|nr:POTRA domain-containing protein [Polaribacter cellanae]
MITFLLLASYINSQENNITKIKIEGNKKLKTSYILSVLSTKKNKPLDSLKIEEDIIFLKRLPAISNVSYKVNKIKKHTYKVLFLVEENFTIIPDVNFWTTTNKQFAFKVGLYDYNFLGKNITFGGFYQNNRFNSYGILFRAPNLFSKNWGLSVNHQNWKSEEPLYFNNSFANYLYNNVSFEVLGLHQFNLKNRIDFGINFFKEEYTYLTGATAPSVPQQLKLNKTLFKFTYIFDGLNYSYQYVKGFKNVLNAQYVITENDFQNKFLIFWNDFFYFRRIWTKGNWANRIRFGLSTNENSPFAPFALDNNVNIRGVGFLVDRGTGVATLNSEYRHTIYDKGWLAVQTNIFVDAGSWRNPAGELDDFIKEENIRVYSGFGLRFISKKIYNATFRIDYGFKVYDGKSNSKGGLVFGIGQYF